MKLSLHFVALIGGKGRGAESHGGEPSLLNATGARCVAVVAMSAFCVTFQFEIDPSLVLLQKRRMEHCVFSPRVAQRPASERLLYFWCAPTLR